MKRSTTTCMTQACCTHTQTLVFKGILVSEKKVSDGEEGVALMSTVEQNRSLKKGCAGEGGGVLLSTVEESRCVKRGWGLVWVVVWVCWGGGGVYACACL